MAAVKVSLITPQQYLAQERDAETKHEYIAGEVYAMAGATHTHVVIASDLQSALALRFVERPCEVYNSDLKVRVAEAGPYFYPDVSVTCDTPIYDEADCLRNPIILIEILSESTGAFDRGGKFLHYRRIASLRHYVLVEQARILVEHYERLESGLWAIVGEHTELTDFLTFTDLGIGVPLAEIYRRVPLPEQNSFAPL